MTSQLDRPRKILTVINPKAGDGDNENLFEKINNLLPQTAAIKLFKTTGEKDQQNLGEIISTFKPDLIFVAGGDGTIKLVAGALGDHQVRLAIIPRGSANGLATDLKIPLDLKKAVKLGLGEHFRKIDALNLNGEMGLHISDMGINAELIKNFEAGNIRGKLGYLLQSVPTLMESKIPYHFDITINGETKTHEAIMVAFANSKEFGTGANVNPQGVIDDGIFEILVFKELSIPQILKSLYGEIQMNTDFVTCFHCTEATITCKQSVAFQIDGEFLGEKNKVVAKIEKEKLLIAVP